MRQIILLLLLMVIPSYAFSEKSLVQRLLSEKSSDRASALEKLFSLDEDKKDSLRIKLEDALQNEDPKIQTYSLDALARLGSSGIPSFQKGLSHTDFRVRSRSLKELKKHGPAAKASVSEVIRLTRDSNYTVRTKAIETLGDIRIPSSEIVPVLRNLMKENDIGIQYRAIDALGKVGPAAKDSTPDLIRAMNPEEDLEIRWRAARALGRMGQPAQRAIPDLVDSLSDKNELLSNHAVQALMNMGPDVVPELEKVLRKKDALKKKKALSILHHLGTPEAKKVLQKFEK